MFGRNWLAFYLTHEIGFNVCRLFPLKFLAVFVFLAIAAGVLDPGTKEYDYLPTTTVTYGELVVNCKELLKERMGFTPETLSSVRDSILIESCKKSYAYTLVDDKGKVIETNNVIKRPSVK
jgi:hypothetical protein